MSTYTIGKLKGFGTEWVVMGGEGDGEVCHYATVPYIKTWSRIRYFSVKAVEGSAREQ